MGSPDPSVHQTPVGQEIDRQVAINRANTPAAVADLRATPRLSISELNNLDYDTIREKLAAHPLHDERPAIVKVLDLLDLSRNTVANIAFGHPTAAGLLGTVGTTAAFGGLIGGPVGAAAGAGIGLAFEAGAGVVGALVGHETRDAITAGQRTAAAGQAEVHFSDVLKHMGVQNRIIRGLVGFGGDLVTDPTLFVGPIGGTARLTNAAGQTVELTNQFTKGVRAADKAIEAGRGIDTSTSIGRAMAAAGHTTESVAAMAPEARAGLASRTLIGDIKGGAIANRVIGEKAASGLADRLSRLPRGGLAGGPEGMIGQYFGREGAVDAIEAAKADAAREVVGEYGVHATPGWKIGSGGQQVFHIPLTNFNISVPAVGAEAGRRVVQGLIATNEAGNAGRALGVIPTAMERYAHDVDTAADFGFRAVTDGEHHAALRVADEALQSMKKLGAMAADPARPASPNDILAIAGRIRQAEARVAEIGSRIPAATEDTADLLHRQMDAYAKMAQAYKGSITQYIDQNPTARDMVNLAKRALGTDSDIVGASVLTPLKTVLDNYGMKDSTAYDYVLKTERALESVFGRRNGAAAEVDRAFRNSLTMGATERGKEIGIGLRDGLKKVLVDGGMDPALHLDEASRLATAFALKARAEAGGENPVIWTTEFGTKEPAAFLQHIADAQKSGMLSKDATGELAQGLDAFAREQMLPVLDRMGQIIEQGKLGKKASGYFPYVPTSSAQSDISQTMRQQLTKQGQAPLGKNPQPGLARESFQKSKDASLEYRFFSKRPGMEGQERRFFHSDMGWLETPEKELKALRANPAERRTADLIDDMREYFNLPEAERPTPKYADPFTMNRMYQQGRFDILTGGRRRPEGFFDLNGITLMASRVAAHERAVARQRWAEYMGQFGVSVDGRAMQGKLGLDGHSLQMADGSTARVSIRSFGGNEYRGVEYGGSFYRPLSSKAGALRDNPLLKGMGIDPEGTGRLFHADVADKIERAAQLVQTDETTKELLKFFDNKLSMWKKWAVWRPAFAINNLVGDSINALMGGARLQDFAKHAENAVRMAVSSHDPEALRKLTFEVAGQRMSGEELWRVLEEHRVVENSQMSDVMANIIGHRWVALPSDIYGRNILQSLSDPKAALEDLAKDYRAASQRFAAAAGLDKPDAVVKFRAGDFLWDDRLNQWLLSPWARVNQKMANSQRTLAFLSHLEQGHDVTAATQKTIRSMFDYSDLTKTEKQFFRRLFPFYSFMRNNGAYQMHLLMQRPIYLGAFPLLENALEEMIDGDAKLPEYMRPGWMREQLALQLGSDPNHRAFYLPRAAFPAEQGGQMLQPLTGPPGLQAYLHELLGSVNPLVGKVAEFAAGREFFSGREINADPLLSEAAPGGFVGELFPPLSEAAKIGKAYSEQGTGAAVGRFFLGGRLQAGNDERLSRMTLRDFKNEEEALRRTASRAQASGNARVSEAARVRLLQLYNRGMLSGHAADVPKWAKTELASQLASAPTPAE